MVKCQHYFLNFLPHAATTDRLGHNAQVILSTIVLRLWIALTTYPSGVQLLLSWVLFTGYAAIAAPLSLRWRLSNLEPVQVWWNLQLHQYGLSLRNNRRALWLMIFLAFWVGLEELLMRVVAIPLQQEQLSPWWLAIAWAIAVLRYPLGYGSLHKSFRQGRTLVLAGLLELVCVIVYHSSQSFWLTAAGHWAISTTWLLPMGGRYQLWQRQRANTKTASE
jgi:predicted Abi (CAAX) family protease